MPTFAPAVERPVKCSGKKIDFATLSLFVTFLFTPNHTQPSHEIQVCRMMSILLIEICKAFIPLIVNLVAMDKGQHHIIIYTHVAVYTHLSLSV